MSPGALPRLDWQPARLAARLEASLRDARDCSNPVRTQGPERVSVQAVASTGSTNTDLLEWARQTGAREAIFITRVAEEQTAGRGRMGRSWQAAPGASLTFSVAMHLNPANGWGALSLALGYAAAQVLQPWVGDEPAHAGGRLMLKWPNDLWWFEQAPQGPEARARGRKVAGILIETLPSPRGGRWVVVGMGVNVQAQALSAVDLPAQGAAGTAEWRPHDDAVSLWHELTPTLLQAMRTFESRGFRDLRAAVQGRDLLVGQPVELSAGPCRTGVCEGIDEDGALLVRGGGGLHRVWAGEAQVRPAPLPHGHCLGA